MAGRGIQKAPGVREEKRESWQSVGGREAFKRTTTETGVDVVH